MVHWQRKRGVISANITYNIFSLIINKKVFENWNASQFVYSSKLDVLSFVDTLSSNQFSSHSTRPEVNVITYVNTKLKHSHSKAANCLQSENNRGHPRTCKLS